MSVGSIPVDAIESRPDARWMASEVTLSRNIGAPIEHPIRLFSLDALGVSFEALRRQVLPSFSELPWDEYDAKLERVELLRRRFPGAGDTLDALLPAYYADTAGLDDVASLVTALDDDDRALFDAIRPFRRRAMARFLVRRSPSAELGWAVEREPDKPFTQPPDDDRDVRGLERHFEPSPQTVTESSEYQAVIALVAALADEARDGTLTRLRVSCHQMGLLARANGTVSNTPEGIHQDGADYIVSALVLERHGIEGGESVVFGPDKRTEYLRHRLLEGQGIFQADLGSPLWHWCTPVRPTDPEHGGSGMRNILGYDVHVI